MKLSVVIPTYGRPQQLSVCLEALAGQDFPRSAHEVIVVDDGSEVPFDEELAHYRNRMSLVLLRQPHAGPAAARNAGAAVARGEVLVFTDDDCIPDQNWLSSVAKRFEEDPERVVGGRTINDLNENLYSSASQLLIDYLYNFYNSVPGKASLLTSNNLAMPASLFRESGRFDTGFTRAAAEDRDLCDRLRQQGVRLTYAPEVIVRHRHALSLLGFCRQHFNYGSGAFRYHKLHSNRTGGSVEMEAPAFYWNLLRFPLKSPGNRIASLTILMALSQVVNAAGYFQQKLAYSLQGKNGHARI